MRADLRAFRASAAAELRTAASIRRDFAALAPASAFRRGVRDAHRYCIRSARWNTAAARLVAERRPS